MCIYTYISLLVSKLVLAAVAAVPMQLVYAGLASMLLFGSWSVSGGQGGMVISKFSYANILLCVFRFTCVVDSF